MESAGVLLHIFDNTEEPGRPWRPCTPPSWCAIYGDRMSTTLVNKQLVHLYGDGNFVSGVILEPRRAQSELLCGYGSDGGSMNKLCNPPGVTENCIPGCQTGSQPSWCTNTSVYDCAWSPPDLAYMLTLQTGAPYTYNELVIGTQGWLTDPAASIEAFFFSRTAGEMRDKAWGAHSSLMAQDAAADRVPVLSLDLSRLERPFAVDQR